MAESSKSASRLPDNESAFRSLTHSCLTRLRRRAEHHGDLSASAPRAAQALSHPRQRKISASRADQGLQVERHAVVASPLVPQAFAAVVEAAHRDAPAVGPRVAQGFDRHPINRTKEEQLSIRLWGRNTAASQSLMELLHGVCPCRHTS